MLIVEQLVKHYPTRSGPLVVLDGVDLQLEGGENVAVVGPSGSGKSTLLNIIGALDRPTSGRVLIEGKEIGSLSEGELAALRNRKIGFVFQEHHLLPQCSVWENVLLPTLPLGGAGPEEKRRCWELLQRVGLAERSDHRPAELSGGERQRAAIARALINRPILLLADEPTGNLDQNTAIRVVELLLELQRDYGMMLVLVTHSGRLARKMQRILALDNGRLTPLDQSAGQSHD